MRLIDADDFIEKFATVPLVQEAMRKAVNQMPTIEPEYSMDEWCTDCTEYDQERHCCPRFNRVIRTALSDRQKGTWIYRSDMNWVDMWQCSECGEKTTSTIMGKPRFKYCPMCGSEMEVTE